MSRAKKESIAARAMRGSSKYGHNNLARLSVEGPELNDQEWKELSEIYEHGLARSTWSNYRTAERLLAKCCKEKGVRLELPVQENTIMAFIHWLAFNRKVRSGTIRNYLAGIRQLHIEKGITEAPFKSERVLTMLKGLKNKEMAERRRAGEEKRKPITPDILRLLKARLSTAEMKNTDKKLIWAVSSVLFHGAFRIHELVAKTESKFDPDYCLLGGDALVKEGRDGVRLQLKLKAPKEDKWGTSIIVDVFETGSDICPVKAFKKWRKNVRIEKDRPLFRFSNGTSLTGRKFNEIIKERLTSVLPEAQGLISSHSFRAGAASMMGVMGYSDEEVKAVGRWSSRAFLDYMKLPRSRRIEIAREWSKNL